MRISDWSSDVCSSDLFRQIEAGQFLAVGVVENARIGVRDRTEVLAAFDAFVDRHSNEDIFDAGAEPCEVDIDRLVIVCAVAGTIVTALEDSADGGRVVVKGTDVSSVQNIVHWSKPKRRDIHSDAQAHRN